MRTKLLVATILSLKYLLTLGIFVVIALKWQETQAVFQLLPSNISFTYILISVSLLPLNFALEAAKLSSYYRSLFPFAKLYQTVWISHAVGFFTPSKLGEYWGRVWVLDKKALALSWYGRIAQMATTLGLGAFAFIGLPLPFLQSWGYVVGVIYWGIYLLLLIFPLNFFIFLNKIIPKHWFNLGNTFAIDILKSPILRLQICALAVLRFFVFTIQYFLLLKAFGISASVKILLGYILWVYLFRSVFAAFTVGDLGIRELAAVTLAVHFAWNVNSALAASLSIYFINQLIPALIGIFLIYKQPKFSVQNLVQSVNNIKQLR